MNRRAPKNCTTCLGAGDVLTADGPMECPDCHPIRSLMLTAALMVAVPCIGLFALAVVFRLTHGGL